MIIKATPARQKGEKQSLPRVDGTSYEIWDKIKPYVDNIIFEGFSLD